MDRVGHEGDSRVAEPDEVKQARNGSTVSKVYNCKYLLWIVGKYIIESKVALKVPRGAAVVQLIAALSGGGAAERSPRHKCRDIGGPESRMKRFSYVKNH